MGVKPYTVQTRCICSIFRWVKLPVRGSMGGDGFCMAEGGGHWLARVDAESR